MTMTIRMTYIDEEADNNYDYRTTTIIMMMTTTTTHTYNDDNAAAGAADAGLLVMEMERRLVGSYDYIMVCCAVVSFN